MAQPIDDAKLRKNLRGLFDKFDVDHSGAISPDEMGRIIAMIGMQMNEATLKQMMADADPDKSGQIEFEEFVAVLKKQVEGGGTGGLASVVQEAGSHFNLLNPFSWFGGGDVSAPEASPPPKSRPASAPTAPRSRSPPKSKTGLVSLKQTIKMTPDSVHTSRPVPEELLEPSAWYVKLARWEVQDRNLAMGDEVRELRVAWKEFKGNQENSIKAYGFSKVREMEEQTRKRIEVQQSLAERKRDMGVKMKKELEGAQKAAVHKNQQKIAKSHERIRQTEMQKRSQVMARKLQAQKSADKTAREAKVERAERKLQTKATVLREEAAARDKAAEVRHETRFEVRQDGRDMFQAKRNATAEEERQRKARDQVKIDYEEKSMQVKRGLHTEMVSPALKAKLSRQKAADAKHQAANEVREKMAAEAARKAQESDERRNARKGMHDHILKARYESYAASAEMLSAMQAKTLEANTPY